MIAFDNSNARLPERFFARVKPTPVSGPRLIKVNEALAAEMGIPIGDLTADVLAGNVIPEGAEPIALAYAGHQFGSFVPQLGDGRAILLGEVVGTDGVRRDVQLKGAGRTPFSRGGDGRAALGPVLREYVVSEAMAALGIRTTRALAAVMTGDVVMREVGLHGAIVTRVAASHMRVGTFEYFAARQDREALVTLVRYALARHYPDALASRDASDDEAALALLGCVTAAHAELVAAWLGIGFVHGVMNTDNTTISGETIDYGPCAFLDEYHPAKKWSSIDRGGRYAFANQPKMAFFNLARLAESLLTVIDSNEERAIARATEVLDRFAPAFNAAYLGKLRQKLGLGTASEEDAALIDDLLGRLTTHEVDYTLFFRALAASADDAAHDGEAAALFRDPGAFHDWAVAWRKRLADEPTAPGERAQLMRKVSPALIPRNHRVEEAIAAAESGDFATFERLVSALAAPFTDDPRYADLRAAPTADQRVRATFCGT